MPDVFHWLGIRRIDRWVSMSNLKRDALRAQGIEIVEQVAIPDRLVPLDARSRSRQKRPPGILRLTGRRSGRSCAAPKAVVSKSDRGDGGRTAARPAGGALLSAAAVRDRCNIVFAAAERGETRHFRLVLDRLDEAVARVGRNHAAALSRSRGAVS